MKFTADAGKMVAALKRVTGTIEARNTIPILSNVLITAAEGCVAFTATNLDTEITTSFAAEVEKQGQTTCSARQLEDYVGKLNKGGMVGVSVEPDGQRRLTCTQGRSRITLLTLPREDFPQLADVSFEHRFAMAGADFVKMLTDVRFAISNEETRYYLNGVYLHFRTMNGAPHLAAVATDGHRLSLHMRGFDYAKAAAFPGIIIPRNAVQLLIKLAEGIGTVDVDVSPTRVRVTMGPTILGSKLIDGTFPDYERVIPAPTNNVAIVDRKALVAVIDRVSTVAKEKGRGTLFSLKPGVMKVSLRDADAGSAEEEIDIKYEAGSLDIGFNGKYVTECLSSFTAGEIKLSAADAGSPALVTSDDDPGRTIVIMPMRA